MPLIHIPKDARKGKEPCGECHIRSGETCDICGAKYKDPPTPLMVAPGDQTANGTTSQSLREDTATTSIGVGPVETKNGFDLE
jgi:hypothetical protein